MGPLYWQGKIPFSNCKSLRKSAPFSNASDGDSTLVAAGGTKSGYFKSH